ncbi:MAG: HAD family hydrolase [Synergistetes bacterium]|nr:HAD family hydrolase [Synergistota bacterium]
MISVTIPGKGDIVIKAVAMDMNGTIALDGRLLPGIKDMLGLLKDKVDIFVLTSDTYGTADELQNILPYVKLIMLPSGSSGEAKVELLREYSWDGIVAIGNGCNDVQMFNSACVSIAVVGREGLCDQLLEKADIVVTDVRDAIALLLNPKRLVATLRL